MNKAKTIKLPCYGIVVELTGNGGAAITSDLHEDVPNVDRDETAEIEQYNAAIDGIESMILAHASAGIDIESFAYIEGIETAVEAVPSLFEESTAVIVYVY